MFLSVIYYLTSSALLLYYSFNKSIFSLAFNFAQLTSQTAILILKKKDLPFVETES